MASITVVSTLLLLLRYSSLVHATGVTIPARLQKSYPLHGLFCFPMGVKLPCDREEEYYSPCCRDYTTNECYLPAFSEWSRWLPCTLECNDRCDDTMECRIKYDQISEVIRPELEEVNGRRRRRAVDDIVGLPTIEDETTWNHRCRVLRSECRSRLAGIWSEWIAIGHCSSTCHRGTLPEVRSCEDTEGNVIDEEFCVGGEASSHRLLACEIHLCPSVEEWTSVGDCFREGLQCFENRTRECTSEDVIYPQLSYECTHETRLCPDNSCDFSGLSTYKYSQWSACNETCTPGYRTRTGNCIYVTNETSSTECDGPPVITQTEECNQHYCHQYTAWTNVGDCTVSCAGGFIIQQRVCSVTGDEIPVNCDTQSATCNDEPCPEFDYAWMEWASCSHTCTSGTRVRSGTCRNVATNETSNECSSGSTTTQTGPCNEDLCEEYIEWNSTDPCATDCGNGTGQWQRTCNVVGTNENPILPSTCTNEERDCYAGICYTVGDWGPYGSCSETCSPGTETRTRDCLDEETNEIAIGCTEALIETQSCNDHLCGVFEYSPSSGCAPRPESCQNTTIVATQTCVGNGSILTGCSGTVYNPCAYDGPEKIVDLLILADSSRFLDTTCLDRINNPISPSDPELEDETLFPNFIQQKKFLQDFGCSWPFIAQDKTRVALMKHSGAVSIGNVLKEFSDTDSFEDVVDTSLGLDCAVLDLTPNFVYFPVVFSTSGGRNSADNVVLLIIPPLTTQSKDDMSIIINSVGIQNHINNLYDSTYFVISADPNPSASDINWLYQLACWNPLAGSCPNYVGTTYDDVQTIIAEMIAVLNL